MTVKAESLFKKNSQHKMIFDRLRNHGMKKEVFRFFFPTRNLSKLVFFQIRAKEKEIFLISANTTGIDLRPNESTHEQKQFRHVCTCTTTRFATDLPL
jgi:hypothetical protein